MKYRMDELLRKWEKNDRTSESIIDEFHQLKNKVEIQVGLLITFHLPFLIRNELSWLWGMFDLVLLLLPCSFSGIEAWQLYTPNARGCSSLQPIIWFTSLGWACSCNLRWEFKSKLLCPWARRLTGCLHLYVANKWWSQAVYPSWWPSVTKDMQTECELIRTNEWKSKLRLRSVLSHKSYDIRLWTSNDNCLVNLPLFHISY